ncbi:metallophosphoesterase [Amphibacillus indicireducens]|uniref:Calcineurin-like phosphoesterase domain-containing protein n=1 Tax=Amphibacillus indicireducens TaxID=1076330 RepID=A0ABP7W014_9BACI
MGDVGVNYYLDANDDQLKEELSQLPITFFCIHGNHEERSYNISTYEEKQWRGGLVFYEEEYPNLLFAEDGEIYDFDGKKAIVIGGAYSVDKFYRLRNGLPWFDSEQPDQRTKSIVEAKLDKESWEVDIVLTHTGPLKYLPTDEFLSSIDQGTVDQSTEIWLDELEEKISYKQWFFGHFHTDRLDGDIVILFNEIMELN